MVCCVGSVSSLSLDDGVSSNTTYTVLEDVERY